MGTFLIAGAVVAVAAVVAFVAERRRPQAPTQPRWAAPSQLDRHDFDQPESPWLVAVFTSSGCDSCRGAIDKARVLSSGQVAVQEIEVGECKELHDRYSIEAVPITVVADTEGVVRATFVGPASATDLWAAVAEARQPGTSPEPKLGQ